MIALISATEDEVTAFLSNLTNKKTTKNNSVYFIEGNFLEIGIVVAISGVGIKKARNCTNTLIKKYDPKIIVSAGFAGALNPKLRLGDLFIPEWALSLKNQEKIYLDNSLPYIAFKYLSGGILTENSFINVKEKKLDLFVQSSADIVDMETWAIAEAAGKLDTRVISVRSVSDLTNQHLPRMEQIFNKESKFDLKKAFGYFGSNPGEIFNFLRFKYVNLRKARISLNSFLFLLVPVLHKVNN
jgi:adenosylhomocysteine nucleosidase